MKTKIIISKLILGTISAVLILSACGKKTNEPGQTQNGLIPTNVTVHLQNTVK